MAKAQEFRKPERWDLPFSLDFPDKRAAERRVMTDRDIERLLGIEPFSLMRPEDFPAATSLEGILRNDTRLRHYHDGTLVVRQGDYGNSAFCIIKGSVRVITKGLDSGLLGRSEQRRRSRTASLIGLFRNPRSPEVRDKNRYPQISKPTTHARDAGEHVFVDDVNVAEAYDGDLDQITERRMPGETQEYLFGELAALGRVPRSATIAAVGEVELLEVRWQGLRDLRKYGHTLREKVDENYREYGLLATLQASPLTGKLDDPKSQAVKKTAEFESYGTFDWHGTYQQLMDQDVDPLSKEPIIAEQGHYPNGLIMIRAGFARLSRRQGDGELTFNYLSKGDTYGLRELLHNAEQPDDPMALTASLRALGYVDIVRIPTKTFEEVILPGINKRVRERIRNEGRRPQSKRSEMDPKLLESLVEHRFVNGTATMVIDLDRCTRCDDCVRACASGHDNNPRFVRHGPVLGHHMIANACMHCADPVCMIGCPTGAIHRSQDGEVVINDLTCIGCGTCAAACPYDNIQMVEIRDKQDNDVILLDQLTGRATVKATKCDLCVEHHGGPACERACPHDALKRVALTQRESERAPVDPERGLDLGATQYMETLAQWLNR